MSSELVSTFHPLKREWAVWISGTGAPTARPSRGKKPCQAPPPERLGSFAHIETMWQYMSRLPPPSCTSSDSTIYIFQKDIDPVWEHPSNVNGGRWMYLIPTENDDAANNAWLALYLGLVGETLDPESEIAGIVLARRRAYTRLSIWTKNRSRGDLIMSIGKQIKEDLAADILTADITLKYQDHNDPSFDHFHYSI